MTVDLALYTKLTDIACRFPTAYEEMFRYYLAYEAELDAFASNAERGKATVGVLQDNFYEFEKRMKQLIRMSGHNIEVPDAIGLFRKQEDARKKLR